MWIGSDFTFRAVGGKFMILVYGSHVNLVAAGTGKVRVAGMPDTPTGDGRYSLNDFDFRSLPGRADRPAPHRLERASSRHGTKPQTVLVVEDEASIASFVAAYLKNAGYNVRTTASGTEALKLVESEKPALVVLDLMLPDIDGVEVCKRIRQTGDLPVLMLTARDEDVDKIIGLEVGADDYMTKPFNPRELVARVRAILRRAAPDSSKREGAVLVHGDLSIDAGRREARVGDQEIQLAPKEFDLLWELLDHRGSRADARPAARAGVGLHVRRRHAHGRRARAPAAPQARRRVADRDRVGRGLQGEPGPRRRHRLSRGVGSTHARVAPLPAAGALPARHRARRRSSQR